MEEQLEAFGLWVQDRLDARQRFLEDQFTMLMEALDSLDESLTSTVHVKSRSSKNNLRRESNDQEQWVVSRSSSITDQRPQRGTPARLWSENSGEVTGAVASDLHPMNSDEIGEEQPHLDSEENVIREGPISSEVQEGPNSCKSDDVKVSDITFLQNLDAESNVIKGAPQVFDEMPQRTNSSLSCQSLGRLHESDDSNHDAQRLSDVFLKGGSTRGSHDGIQSVLRVKDLGVLATSLKFDEYVLPLSTRLHGSLFQYLDAFEVSNTWVKLLDYREVNSWGKRSLFAVMLGGLPCLNVVSLQSFGLNNTKGKKHKVRVIESYASMTKEVAGVAEPVPSPWIGQTTVFKFAQASALDHIFSREWQIKLTDHHSNSDMMRQSDSPNSLHSKVSNSCAGVNFVSLSERENYKHTLERHANRSHDTEDGIHAQVGGAKDVPCVRPCIERVHSLVLLDVLQRSSMPFTDGQPVNPHGKHAGFESQLPHDVSRPKVRLLPKPKSAFTPEPSGVKYKLGVEHKQGAQQPFNAILTRGGGHIHLISSHVVPGLGGNKDGHENARLKYEQRETKACIGKDDTLSFVKQKWQHVILTRDMALLTIVLALGVAKPTTYVFDPGGHIIMWQDYDFRTSHFSKGATLMQLLEFHLSGQSCVHVRENKKLSPKYYGPFHFSGRSTSGEGGL